MLSRLTAETGSAPFEFVTVTIPTTFMVLSLHGLFGLAFSTQALTEQAYELARYAALADVTEADVLAQIETLGLNAEVSRRLEGSACFYEAKIASSVGILGWPYPIQITLAERASCEI